MLTASANSVDEGDSVEISVTGATANSTVDYTITGENIDEGDVDSLTGTITTDANGEGSATIAVTADNVTEGEETMTVTLDGTTVSADIIINDVSQEGQVFELTTADDILLASDAELPEGVDEADVVRTTDGDDTIEGTASSLSATRTLNSDDFIDGGEGYDMFNVELLSSFGGFSEDGGLANVEMVSLTNASSIGRTFDATGVAGVEMYVLNSEEAAVNLSNLSDEAVVTVNDAQDDFSISYDADAELADVTLELNLNGVGALDDEDTNADERVVVTPTIGAEATSLVLTVTGDNVLDLSDTSAEMLTIAGAGTTDIEAVNSELAEVEASEAEGDVTLNVTGADEITTVALGSGDDSLTATTGSMRINAVVAGGDGSDEFALSGTGTVEFEMTGVETLSLSGGILYSALNTDGIETLVQGTGANRFVNAGDADLTVSLDGGSGGSLLVDNSGSTVVEVDDADETVDADVTLSDSQEVIVNVAADTTFGGSIVASLAGTLTVNASGMLDGAGFTADEATSVVLDLGDEDHTFEVTAAKATDVQILGAEGGVTITGDLSGAETFEANVDGELSVGTMSAPTGLDSAADVNVSGSGTVNFNDLGSDANDYGLTVNAGLSGNLSAGNVLVGEGQDIVINVADVLGEVAFDGAIVGLKGLTGSIEVDADGSGGLLAVEELYASDVTVDASGRLGGVTIGDTGNITTTGIFADNATVVGSRLEANTIIVDVTSSADLSGGLQDDTFIIDVTNDTGDVAEIEITGGAGADTFDVSPGASLGGAAIITVTDFEAGDSSNFDELLGRSDFLDAEQAIDFLIDAGLANATAEADDIEFLDAAVNTIFTFNGDTFFARNVDAPDVFNNGDVIVKLVGVQDVDEVLGALETI